jgi:hypothetical protein
LKRDSGAMPLSGRPAQATRIQRFQRGASQANWNLILLARLSIALSEEL